MKSELILELWINGVMVLKKSYSERSNRSKRIKQIKSSYEYLLKKSDWQLFETRSSKMNDQGFRVRSEIGLNAF